MPNATWVAAIIAGRPHKRDATGIRPTRMTFAIAKRVSHAEPVDFCAPVLYPKHGQPFTARHRLW
jgi:hypothetical protein